MGSNKTLECISMEMDRVAKWKLIESKTVRNSLVIWFMQNVNHIAIIQHVPISNRLTHLTYDSLCHIAHSFSWSNQETSVQQSWFTWHTFNNEKAMLSISIHRCQNCLTLQERLMLAPENGHLSFNGKLQKNNLFPTHPYQVSGQRTAVSGARNNT